MNVEIGENLQAMLTKSINFNIFLNKEAIKIEDFQWSKLKSFQLTSHATD